MPFSVNQYLNFSVGPIVTGPLQFGTLTNLNYSFQKLLKGAVACLLSAKQLTGSYVVWCFRHSPEVGAEFVYQKPVLNLFS